MHQFSPKITPNDFPYVHHMLIYLCGSLDETEVGTSAPCEGMVGETVSECRSGSLIAGWAVGGAVSLYTRYPNGHKLPAIAATCIYCIKFVQAMNIELIYSV